MRRSSAATCTLDGVHEIVWGRVFDPASGPRHEHVGTAALGCPVERRSTCFCSRIPLRNYPTALFTSQKLVLLLVERHHAEPSLPNQRRISEELVRFHFGRSEER